MSAMTLTAASELHRKILADAVRNEAFHKALSLAITPGKTVMGDIGAGTGFLAFLAAKQGAKHCYLYEVNKEVSELSKQIAQGSHISNLTFVAKHTASVKKPPKLD